MDIKEFIKPSAKKISIFIIIFSLTFFVGDSGVGFPFKFWTFGIFSFLSSGFFKPIFLIVDLIFVYGMACFFTAIRDAKGSLKAIFYTLLVIFVIWYLFMGGIKKVCLFPLTLIPNLCN